MSRISLILFFIFLVSFTISAQVLPREGSGLHYRLIGFSVPAAAKSSKYTLELAYGYINSLDSFRKKVIKTQQSEFSRLVVEVPLFGAQYTWRITGKGVLQSGLHHFSTSSSEIVDTSHLRLRIIDPATTYKDGYVFLDGNKALYDMSGNPVWFLPERTIKSAGGGGISDLKMSPYGTITFLSGQKAFEINYDGDILWKIPDEVLKKQAMQENCHHEFTRLGNGNYMVLGSEMCEMPAAIDAGAQIDGSAKDSFSGTQTTNRATVRVPFGTVVEYDTKGNVVWTWKSSEYFEKSDLVNYKPEHGNDIVDIHENAFFFDEAEQVIYISFKNISRIVKVKYPEGTVLNAYGETYKAGVPAKGNDLFCYQHACKRSQIGCLFLFNNNGCSPGKAPKIKMLQEQKVDVAPLKKIWEYQCTIDDNYPQSAPSGGNVIELPDRSLFVAMAGPYSKLFIVNMNKQVLWSALPEIWNSNEKKWLAYGQYRASIIADAQKLETLIWQKQTKN